MYAEDLVAPQEIRRSDDDLTVEASRPEQRGVEILESVRGAHDHDLVRTTESVDLDEELVQRLVVLAVVCAPRASRADRVELVDEDDRRRVLARLLEELADARRAEAGEHLDERRRARRVEVRARLVCDGLRQQGLARPRRAVQQNSLRDTGAETFEPLPILEKLDDLFELLLRLVRPATSPQPTGPVVSRSTIAGLTLGTRDIVRSNNQMMIPKNTIGNQVMRKPPMSSTEWGQVTMPRLSAGATRD